MNKIIRKFFMVGIVLVGLTVAGLFLTGSAMTPVAHADTLCPLPGTSLDITQPGFTFDCDGLAFGDFIASPMNWNSSTTAIDLVSATAGTNSVTLNFNLNDAGQGGDLLLAYNVSGQNFIIGAGTGLTGESQTTQIVCYKTTSVANTLDAVCLSPDETTLANYVTTDASGTPVFASGTFPGTTGFTPVNVKDDVESLVGGNITNFSQTFYFNTASSTTTSTPPVTPSADLSITKTVDNATPQQGNTVNYTVTVVNLGPATSTDAVATDTLPSGLTFENATASIGTYASSTGTWTIGDLSASSTASLEIAAQVDASTTVGQTITNTATVGESASTTDANPANNSASASLTVTGQQGGGGGSCDEDIVSDTSNLVYGSGPVAISSPYGASWVDTTSMANGSTAALVATPYNPLWTASIPGASWIWVTPTVDNPAVNEAFVFKKTFAVNGTPTSATLDINADNSYSVAINGVTVEANPTERNYFVQNEGIFNVASALHNGTNTIAITVANFGVQSSTPVLNPAGLLYKLAVVTPTCATTSTPPVTPSADLSITKTVDNATPKEGDTINYTLTVAALGPATSTDAVATDTLPSGLTFENATATVGTYASSTGTWTIGDLSASSTADLEIAALVDAGTAGKTIVNTAIVGENASTTDNNPSNNSSSIPVTVQTNGCTTNCGGGVPTSATSTITVNVNGLNASDTAQIAVQDLTASTTQATSTGNGSSTFVLTTNDGYAVTATTTNPNYSVATSTGCAGTLAANATCNITFTLASTTPSTDADIAITKTVDNANPVAGATVNYTITVTANGPAASSIVNAQDILPMGLSLVSASTSVGTYDMSTGNWAIGTLSPNATATLVIAAQVANNESGQTITNTATVTELSSLVDQNPGNNSSSVSINVQPAACTSNCGGGGTTGGGGGSIPTAEIVVAKTVDNANPNPGDTIHYTVTIDDQGPAQSPGVVATDTLPSGITFVSASSSTGSYNSTTGTWTIGILPVNDVATLVITATVNSSDSIGQTITNTATVGESNSVNNPLQGNDSSSVTITVGGSSSTGGGGGTSGGGGGNGGVGGGGSNGGGEVLGASATCGIYLDQYIHPIRKYLNDPTEVDKLQTFLNMNLGTTLPITGYYGPETIAAVNQFQVKYHIEVLQPWLAYGLPTEYTPTEYVYKTTQRWINLIMCSSLNLPIPQLP